MSLLSVYRSANGGEFVRQVIQQHYVLPTALSLLSTGVSRTGLELLRLNISSHVMRHLRKRFAPHMERLRADVERRYAASEVAPCKRIWCLWLDGEQSAPECVRMCIASMRRHMPDWEVVVLDKDTWQDYVTLPPHVLERYKMGMMTTAHLSDLIRIALLNEHGGMWLDATVLLTDSVPSYVCDADLFFFRAFKPGSDGQSIPLSSWCIASQKPSRILLLAQLLLLEYWKDSERQIDYYLAHYCLQLASEQYPVDFAHMAPLTNETPHLLLHRLFDAYDEHLFQAICAQTSIHKLSYKRPAEDFARTDTFYAHVRDSYAEELRHEEDEAAPDDAAKPADATDTIELFGVPGSGKTYLANELVQKLAAQGVDAINVTERSRSSVVGKATNRVEQNRLAHSERYRTVREALLRELATYRGVVARYNDVGIDYYIDMLARYAARWGAPTPTREKRASRVFILDEGLPQMLATIIVNFGIDEAHLVSVLAMLPMPGRTAWVHVPLDTAKERIRRRDRHVCYIDELQGPDLDAFLESYEAACAQVARLIPCVECASADELMEEQLVVYHANPDESSHAAITAFVVLHYMAIDETIPCVESIRRVAHEGDKIIVVDNASPNGTGSDLVRTYAHDPDVDVVLLAHNIGFARGNNVGYAYARQTYDCAYIVVMNNDMELPEQTDLRGELDRAYAEYAFHILGPDIYATAAGYHQNPQRRTMPTRRELEQRIRTMRTKYALRPLIRLKWSVASILQRESAEHHTDVYVDEPQTGVLLHGSFYVFSREFIEREPACFFDGTFMYMEAEILHWQSERKGYVELYWPGIKVLHHEDASTDMAYAKRYDKAVFSLRCLIQSCEAFLALMDEGAE